MTNRYFEIDSMQTGLLSQDGIYDFDTGEISTESIKNDAKKTLSPRLKEGLSAMAEKAGDTPPEKMIKDYPDVLDKNGHKLTSEVKKFRENAVDSLCK